MDEHRKWKNRHTEEGQKQYEKLNNELRRETVSAKEKWWENECQELEEMDQKGRSDLVYAKVSKLTWNKKVSNKSSSIKDSAGNLITDPEEVKERWRVYIESLYDKDGKSKKEKLQVEADTEIKKDKRPTVLKSKMPAAIK